MIVLDRTEPEASEGAVVSADAGSAETRDSAKIILNEMRQRIYRQTDKIIAFIMCLQWPAAIAAALWIAPHTWIGSTSLIHPHVWTALYLGGMITIFPVTLTFLLPGRILTRHVLLPVRC